MSDLHTKEEVKKYIMDNWEYNQYKKKIQYYIAEISDEESLNWEYIDILERFEELRQEREEYKKRIDEATLKIGQSILKNGFYEVNNLKLSKKFYIKEMLKKKQAVERLIEHNITNWDHFVFITLSKKWAKTKKQSLSCKYKKLNDDFKAFTEWRKKTKHGKMVTWWFFKFEFWKSGRHIHLHLMISIKQWQKKECLKSLLKLLKDREELDVNIQSVYHSLGKVIGYIYKYEKVNYCWKVDLFLELRGKRLHGSFGCFYWLNAKLKKTKKDG